MKKEDLIKAVMPIAGITQENTGKYFDWNFLKWQALNSDTITQNGDKITSVQLGLILAFADEETIKEIEFDKLKGGFPLTKDKFIHDEILKYESLYQKWSDKPMTSLSKRENGALNKIWIYLQYLKDYFEQKREETQNIDNLKDLFIDSEKYTEVMQFLIDKKLINPDTYYSIDEEKGNKGYLSSLIKNLYTKRYLIKNPNTPEIQNICLNTFGKKIGTRTIAGAKQNDFDFAFILHNTN